MIVAQRFDAPAARPAPLDFDEVLPHHRAIHARLQNWSRSVRTRDARPATSPMFRLYRSTDAASDDAPPPRMPCDPNDARAVELAVRELPEELREALRWYYVFDVPADRLASYLRIHVSAIPDLIHEGRESISGLLARTSPGLV